MEAFQIMMDAVPPTHKIYINTTLPVSTDQPEETVLDFIERNMRKIACINVSRHLQHYVVESNDSLLAKLPVPFRVNCVLYENYPVDQLVPYLERFRKIPGASIQFRFDYTATTQENLYDEENDKILRDLKRVAKYTGLDGCLPFRLQGNGADIPQDAALLHHRGDRSQGRCHLRHPL
jgi:hypothetical protein